MKKPVELVQLDATSPRHQDFSTSERERDTNVRSFDTNSALLIGLLALGGCGPGEDVEAVFDDAAYGESAAGLVPVLGSAGDIDEVDEVECARRRPASDCATIKRQQKIPSGFRGYPQLWVYSYEKGYAWDGRLDSDYSILTTVPWSQAFDLRFALFPPGLVGGPGTPVSHPLFTCEDSSPVGRQLTRNPSNCISGSVSHYAGAAVKPNFFPGAVRLVRCGVDRGDNEFLAFHDCGDRGRIWLREDLGFVIPQ